jgi:hypothetical protein
MFFVWLALHWLLGVPYFGGRTGVRFVLFGGYFTQWLLSRRTYVRIWGVTYFTLFGVAIVARLYYDVSMR